MGRGISEQQKKILGVAYHANRITQGAPKLKTGATVPNYKIATVNYTGGKDMLWPLAAHVLRGLPFTSYNQKVMSGRGRYGPAGGYFDLIGKEAKSVKASTIRAITALEKRDLLRLAPLNKPVRYGYVLTREGFEIGAEHEVEFDPWVYVRAGMVWYPQNTDNRPFFSTVKAWGESVIALPDLLKSANEIKQQMRDTFNHRDLVA